MQLEEFARLARARRTHMLVEKDRPVPQPLVEELCEVGTWAPAHKKTWPWKFAHLTGDARHRLGEAFVADMNDRDVGDDGKRIKTRTKYARTPSVLVVGCEPHDKPTLHDENRDAVAAAIQNILLAATAAGLASFWSTPALIDAPRVLDLCGFDAHDRILGVLYLGWPAGGVEAPERPPAAIVHLDA
jgi:nitroreductase